MVAFLLLLVVLTSGCATTPSKPTPVDSQATRKLIGGTAYSYVLDLADREAFGAAFARGERTIDMERERAGAFGPYASGPVRVESVSSAAVTATPKGVEPSSDAEGGASAAYWEAQVGASAPGGKEFLVDLTGQIDSMNNVIVCSARFHQ